MTKNKVVFDAEKHEYKLGDKVLISCTQLLKKHGLVADYSAINEEVLTAKAERGTLIHKELENFLKNNIVGFTSECENFSNWYEKQCIENAESEQLVNNDVVAGTLDFRGEINGVKFIADFKTSSKLDKEGVRWQLSIYNYLSGGNAEKLFVIHFPTDTDMKIVEIRPKAVEEVEKLINCERNGEIYQRNQLELAQDLALKLEEAELAIKTIELQKKQAEENAMAYREALISAMEQADVKKWETPSGMSITYVEAGFRTSIDSAALKKEMPEIALKYTKQTPYKASLRVKFNEVQNGSNDENN